MGFHQIAMVLVVLSGFFAPVATVMAAATGIVVRDQTSLRAAPRDAAQQQALLWQGEVVEIRGERRDEHPRSYKRIEVKHIVTGHGVSAASVEKAVHLSTDKYCSVAATLRPTAEIVSTWEIHEAEA